MACSGDIESLDTLYRMNGTIDLTYRKFGREHSLLMGAYRNHHWETVDWLKSHGAALTPQEQKELSDQGKALEFLREMAGDLPASGDPDLEDDPAETESSPELQGPTL